jgi:hypothetical protein
MKNKSKIGKEKKNKKLKEKYMPISTDRMSSGRRRDGCERENESEQLVRVLLLGLPLLLVENKIWAFIRRRGVWVYIWPKTLFILCFFKVNFFYFFCEF